MIADPSFCMSSWLMYRAVVDHQRSFSPGTAPRHYRDDVPRTPVNTPAELEAQLRANVAIALEQGSVGLMLSGGMDSAILAAMVPAGTKAYTLRCHARDALDEVPAAAAYAAHNHLQHEIVDVYWDDYEALTLPLMVQKGCPIHSIEVQIGKAARQAKADGVKNLIFGETADIIYGGHSKLLARNWTAEEFVRRFAFVDPRRVLREPQWITAPVEPYIREDGTADVFAFLNGFEYPVSLGFYSNACRLGGVELCAPYSKTILGHPLDLERVRRGESKYLVRELYQKLYPGFPVLDKTPLPRPMSQWLADWAGPEHPAFCPGCQEGLTGDQKWYVYTLERFMREVVEKE